MDAFIKKCIEKDICTEDRLGKSFSKKDYGEVHEIVIHRDSIKKTFGLLVKRAVFIQFFINDTIIVNCNKNWILRELTDKELAAFVTHRLNGKVKYV